MRVKKAAHVCSRTFSVAIKTCLLNKPEIFAGIPESTVLATAEYLRMFNNAFDVFNSRSNLSANPLKRPIKRENSDAKEFLQVFVDYLKSIKVKPSVQCIKGWNQTVNGMMFFLISIFILSFFSHIGILGITNELFKEFEELEEIALFNFISDPIENLFSVFRGDQGKTTFH